jgi:hypothetical protein
MRTRSAKFLKKCFIAFSIYINCLLSGHKDRTLSTFLQTFRPTFYEIICAVSAKSRADSLAAPYLRPATPVPPRSEASARSATAVETHAAAAASYFSPAEGRTETSARRSARAKSLAAARATHFAPAEGRAEASARRFAADLLLAAQNAHFGIRKFQKKCIKILFSPKTPVSLRRSKRKTDAHSLSPKAIEFDEITLTQTIHP